MEKLKTFKIWLLEKYELTPDQLKEKPVGFQARIHSYYTDYVRMWENAEMEEVKHSEVN
ncbi:hypothetical protein ACV7JQ_09185 [Globicatella sulfidifaciens]